MINQLLSKFQKVKKTGANKWLACCPVHDDRTPSLAIRDDNGKIIMHCFGCGANGLAVIEVVGMDAADLFPPSVEYDKRGRSKIYAADVLQAIAFEADIVAISASQLAQGITLSEADNQRLQIAASRLAGAATYAR